MGFPTRPARSTCADLKWTRPVRGNVPAIIGSRSRKLLVEHLHKLSSSQAPARRPSRGQAAAPAPGTAPQPWPRDGRQGAAVRAVSDEGVKGDIEGGGGEGDVEGLQRRWVHDAHHPDRLPPLALPCARAKHQVACRATRPASPRPKPPAHARGEPSRPSHVPCPRAARCYALGRPQFRVSTPHTALHSADLHPPPHNTHQRHPGQSKPPEY